MPTSPRSAAYGAASTGTVTVPVPTRVDGTTGAGVVIGDSMFAIAFSDDALIQATAPSGWAASPTVNSQTGVGVCKVWSKTATATEQSPTAWGAAGQNATTIVFILVFPGSASIDVGPVFQNGTSASQTRTAPAPGAATTADGCLVTAFASIANNNGPDSYTTPAGMTERFDVGDSAAPYMSAALDTQTLTATGSPGTRTSNAAQSSKWQSVSFIVKGSSTTPVWFDTATATDTFSKTETVVGKLAADTISTAEVFTGVGTGTVNDAATVADGFLITQMEYDAQRGRVRLSAFTFGPTVVRVRVSRRTLNGKFAQVRGGVVDTIGGYMRRPVDDYEYPAGVDVEYEIAGLTDTGVVVQRSVIRRNASGDKVWLKFVANPDLNRRVNLTNWSAITRASRADVFDVIGQKEPTVVTDVFGGRRVTIELITENNGDTDTLDDALSNGFPIFFQVPASLQLPTMYASVGDYSYERLSRNHNAVHTRSRWTIPLTEVLPPAPTTVVEDFVTYADLLAQYPTYDAMLDAYDTYRGLLITN